MMTFLHLGFFFFFFLFFHLMPFLFLHSPLFPPILFAPVFLSSEVKEAVMAEPEKVPENSEEVRAQRSANPTLPFTTYLHIKRQTTFNKWLSSFPLYFSVMMHYFYYRYMQALLIMFTCT